MSNTASFLFHGKAEVDQAIDDYFEEWLKLPEDIKKEGMDRYMLERSCHVSHETLRDIEHGAMLKIREQLGLIQHLYNGNVHQIVDVKGNEKTVKVLGRHNGAFKLEDEQGNIFIWKKKTIVKGKRIKANYEKI
jgi:hypothetical protein